MNLDLAINFTKNQSYLIKKKINIVWIKRDLRSQDHEPLLKASNLYGIDPYDLHFSTTNGGNFTLSQPSEEVKVSRHLKS